MLKTFSVLGVKIAATDYSGAFAEIVRLNGLPHPTAVSACNTHLVAAARADATFSDVLDSFDLILPDGMPLVWMLNRQKAGLLDRVYGPYLMRTVLQNAPRPWKHFFFGSSESCLEDLVQAARKLQPEIEIVGSFSPAFGVWNEADHREHAQRITDSGADFIWVALGGEKQERWIIEQKARFQRGTFLAVGDAFELLAGRRAYAPAWIQSHGLTWAYRLLQDPRRLWPRYFKYNGLFLSYLLKDALFPNHQKKSRA